MYGSARSLVAMVSAEHVGNLYDRRSVGGEMYVWQRYLMKSVLASPINLYPISSKDNKQRTDRLCCRNFKYLSLLLLYYHFINFFNCNAFTFISEDYKKSDLRWLILDNCLINEKTSQDWKHILRVLKECCAAAAAKKKKKTEKIYNIVFVNLSNK